jgi:hypothetical protein
MTIIRIIILILAAALAWASWREAERDREYFGRRKGEAIGSQGWREQKRRPNEQF